MRVSFKNDFGFVLQLNKVLASYELEQIKLLGPKFIVTEVSIEK